MEAPRGTEVQLRVLGGFGATHAGEQLPLTSAAQRVLGFLAVADRRRPVTRAVVAETLWPDTRADRAASNLRTALWRMPRPLGRALVHGTAYDLRLADEVRVDLWQACDLVDRVVTTPASAAEASYDLWCLQDDLLPHWDEEWLELEREEHRQRRLHALETLSRSLLALDRYPQALAAALGAVSGEPLRETAHCRVIEVHLREGNASEAIRQYRRYAHLLADELGLRPSAPMRRLVEPLLSAAELG